jgi:hypothetical protein
MKELLKKILSIAGRPIDFVIAVIAMPCAVVLLAYRKAGSVRLPITTRMLKKVGVFPIRKQYYEPLFNFEDIKKPLSQDRFLPGIDLDIAGQLDFLSRLTYSAELLEMDLAAKGSDVTAFSMQNPSFGSGDADYLYQFLRAVKPGKLIEIGSGHSTKMARLSLLKNVLSSDAQCSHTCIEPYEMSWLEQVGGVQIIRKRLEDCDIDWKDALSDGDLLFIDSSHMIRPQGDVLKEYLEILPQLSSGVYVHVHDIFTPRDYLDSWLRCEVRFWNEQYLLEAVLANTTRYKIVGALNFLHHNHYNSLKNVCPYLTPDREPGSIYFRII